MITAMSIVCFLMGLFFLIATNTTRSFKVLTTIIFRVLGALGTVLPIIYWFKK